MSPTYVRKYIETNRLTRLDQNVFECLREELARLYLDDISGPPGRVMKRDVSAMLGSRSVEPERVDLVMTSPPGPARGQLRDIELD